MFNGSIRRVRIVKSEELLPVVGYVIANGELACNVINTYVGTKRTTNSVEQQQDMRPCSISE